MSVVVRMEMPKHCGECELQIWDIWPGSFKCAKTRTDIMSHMRNRTKPNDCPIICQLPEGHGRLVDADEMYKKSEAFCNQCRQGEHDCEKCNYIVAQGYMYKSTTIVPAAAERKVDASDSVTPTDTPTDTPTVAAERSET